MTRVTEYVVDRVGSTWTLEDAAFVLDKIEQIEALARKIAEMKRERWIGDVVRERQIGTIADALRGGE